jgi:hypothetical protein
VVQAAYPEGHGRQGMPIIFADADEEAAFDKSIVPVALVAA